MLFEVYVVRQKTARVVMLFFDYRVGCGWGGAKMFNSPITRAHIHHATLETFSIAFARIRRATLERSSAANARMRHATLETSSVAFARIRYAICCICAHTLRYVRLCPRRCMSETVAISTGRPGRRGKITTRHAGLCILSKKKYRNAFPQRNVWKNKRNVIDTKSKQTQ
jgi:hypothetical protein